MLDRECKDDLPALVTKVSRSRQRRLDAAAEESDSAKDSPAVIIRRQSQESIKKWQLPYAEVYNEQKKARNPYLCLPCNKKFAKSSLNSHVKSKHPGKRVKVKCCLCDKVWDRHTKALDHVSSKHKVYPCPHCCTEDTEEEEAATGLAFSEFDKLKAHLKASHEGSEWPWICGFCDLVLLYDLEFEVHIKQHTEKPPFACPICSRLFSDNARLREHLARQHLPSRDSKTPEPQSLAQIKFEKQQAQLAQHQLEAFEKLAASMTDKSSKAVTTTSSSVKDEAAVSRELAALLLNLHDSNGSVTRTAAAASTTSVTKVDNFPKAEDLSLKSSVETAIDLTKAKPEITLTPTMPASITKLVKGQSAASSSNGAASGVTVTKTSVKAPNYPAAASYPFYPSLAASMSSLSPTLAMNSNYLLHNLLLGKFQQIANSSTSTSASASTASNTTATLPTHPLPAQTLSLPASKPPASVLKSANGSSSGNPTSTTSAEAAARAAAVAAGYNLQLLNETSSNGGTSNGSGSNIDIPYMCRQIVTLLNGLLFHQHNLNNPTVEMNVHTQLGAIYTRLQEVVAMVEQAKKQQETTVKVAGTNGVAASNPTMAASIKKDGTQIEKHLKLDSKQKEEEKIAKHIHEYQRALLKQHHEAAAAKEAASNASTDSMASLLKKPLELQQQQQVDVVDSMEEEAALKNRRRGRPPKNSNMDLSYSPPEKKMRPEQPLNQEPSSSNKFNDSNNSQAATLAAVAAAAAAVSAQHHHNNGVASSNNVAASVSSKGGKGIRNRVFCGECTGCLKNDDCGKCRYCKDKTKFGGQNRLRQKCLHRRCQLDTHRRRSSQNNNVHVANGSHQSAVGQANNSSFSDNANASRQSPSPDAIYSGVALARLASQNLVVDTSNDKNIDKNNGQLSPGEIIRTSGQPVFPQASQRSDLEDQTRSENNPPHHQSHRAQQRSGSSASNASDEDTDDHKSGSRTQSRIDKWKAKHEAMLKMASNDKKDKDSNPAAAAEATNTSEDETPDIKTNCLTKIQAAIPAQAAVLSVK